MDEDTMNMMKMTCNYKEKDATEVIPRIWLGGCKVAMNKNFLIEHNIKYIINVTKDCPNKFSDIQYLKISVDDSDVCNKNLDTIFNITNDFIIHALKNKSNILIHCKRGHHRSASIVCAFMLKYMNLNYLEVIMYINYIRSCALRRNTCMTAGLFEYYKKLNGS